MQTVCELKTFTRAAAEAGLSAQEVDDLIAFLSGQPNAGEPMVGTGGCRKLRWARAGKGKRGGVRTITFYSGEEIPVFLITVFGKGDKANLTQQERNDLRKLTKVLVAEYGNKVRKVGT